jgi:two-component system, LuxR family, sensor kinase FixL
MLKTLPGMLVSDCMQQASIALIESRSPDDVAEILLDVALAHSQASAGAVFLREKDGYVASATSLWAESAAPKARCPTNAPQLDLAVPVNGFGTVDHLLLDKVPSTLDGAFPVSALWLPLRYREDAVGFLHLEKRPMADWDTQAVGTLSMMARQAAASVSHFLLSEVLVGETRLRQDAEENSRELYDSMLKHQRIGRMGDFRFNTRTLRSKGSNECYRMFGYEPEIDVVEYNVWMEKLHPNDRARVHEEMAAAFAKRVPLRFEYRIIKDGEVRHILSEGHPELDRNGDLLYCGVVVDVTERKMSEEIFANVQTELSTTLRLASLGELAGSVVHEVNQPLTAMISNADACRRWLAREPADLREALDAVDQIAREGRRAVAVIGGLEALAKGAQIRLSYVNLNDVILEVLTLSRTQLERARVAVRADLHDSLPEIQGDRLQLQQVIFNLLKNAIEARKAVHDRPRLLRISSQISDDEIVTAFHDVGEGVEPAHIDRIFEPLFTTKGEGLGLGLSICRRIIKAHKGAMWAEPNEQHGLSVMFTLPRK